MKKSCKFCGRAHPAGAACSSRPKAGGGRANTRIRSFRNSYAWQRKRAEIQGRDHYMCRACIQEGRITYTGLGVHHIEPLSERFDLRLSDSNLISLCDGHHKAAGNGDLSRRSLADIVKQDIPPRASILSKKPVRQHPL